MVMNGAQRVGRVPDVPTTLEAGYKDADFPIWIGILAPAKTPHDVSSTEFDTRIRKRSAGEDRRDQAEPKDGAAELPAGVPRARGLATSLWFVSVCRQTIWPMNIYERSDAPVSGIATWPPLEWS
jgi:hypothetical protein